MAELERQKRYSFGPFVLDTSAASLRRGKEPLPMTWKRYEILLLLVENAGRLMLKEEILDRIWPDQYTGEANLANNIHAIRRLIEDDPRQPQLILTIPGQGYRFQGEVKVLEDSSPAENSALDGDDASSPPNEASRKAGKWSVRRGRVALVGASFYSWQSLAAGPYSGCYIRRGSRCRLFPGS